MRAGATIRAKHDRRKRGEFVVEGTSPTGWRWAAVYWNYSGYEMVQRDTIERVPISILTREFFERIYVNIWNRIYPKLISLGLAKPPGQE